MNDERNDGVQVILVMALTVDGKIGRDRDHFPDWTGTQDKKMFKGLTQQAGVVIMGSRTYETIGHPLPGRLNVVMTRRPARFAPAENLMCTGLTPRKLLEDLGQKGFARAVLAGGATINSLFAKQGCIDELWITVSPKIFGTGLDLFSADIRMDLELIEHRQLDAHSLLMRYRPVASD